MFGVWQVAGMLLFSLLPSGSWCTSHEAQELNQTNDHKLLSDTSGRSQRFPFLGPHSTSINRGINKHLGYNTNHTG